MKNLIIKWRGIDVPHWVEFDTADLRHRTLREACHTFISSTGQTEVVARQGESYIVNTPALLEQYKRKGKRVTSFESFLDFSTDLDKPFTGFFF